MPGDGEKHQQQTYQTGELGIINIEKKNRSFRHSFLGFFIFGVEKKVMVAIGLHNKKYSIM